MPSMIQLAFTVTAWLPFFRSFHNIGLVPVCDTYVAFTYVYVCTYVFNAMFVAQ